MIKIATLKNGIRVITEHLPHVQTVSLGTWVGVGSRFEEKSENGISHFLEHMAFKGTKTRSALDIAQAIENVGGYVNAYTGKDMTGYYVRLLKEDMLTGLDIISDIFQHASMDEKELNTEKGVIIQEINMYKDQPEAVVEQNFNLAAYPNQPFGRDIGGDAEVIRTMTPQKMLEYMHRQYTADRVIISASGAVNHEDFVANCEKLFCDVNTHKGKAAEPARYVGGSRYETKVHEQVNFLLGFEGVPYDSPNYWTMKVLAVILGAGMTSRLFQEIREKRGLVYTVHASADSDADTGMFSIYAGTGEKQVAELVPVLCDEIKKFSSTLIQSEIDRAKTQIKARLLMQNENPSSHTDTNARMMLHFGRVISEKEMLASVKKVSMQDLQECADSLFRQKPTVAALGPISHLMSYDDICARLKG
ncbi:MAG: insulinase family protein [Alphaproteobacteria bacterium]|nr:insulinase family protein [Alphaproteobacteria bacterium]